MLFRSIGVIAGDLQDAESLKATKDLFTALGVKNLDARQDGAALGAGPRESWLFNSTIAGIEDAEFAARVRADGIDVLVDLAGHNATNRLRAFARRLAPVQITGIGYAGTTGMAAMDYRLADPVADHDADAHYAERLMRLPRCLW